MTPPVGALVPPLPGALPDEPCLSPRVEAIYEFVKLLRKLTCAALAHPCACCLRLPPLPSLLARWE